PHDLAESSEIKGLRTVRQSAFRAGMHFDDETIGSHGDGGAGHSRDQALLPGSVGRIGDHGQVREIAGESYGRQVDGVAHLGFESLNAALAENDLLVASRQQILGGEQPLFHRRGGASLQQDGLVDGGETAQQGEVLHVAGADLQHVDVLADDVHILGAHDFGDHGQSGFFASFAENLECLQAKALKVVWGSAGLVGSAAQHGGSRALYGVCCVEQLCARFHRTGAGDDHDFRSADGHTVDSHDGALRLDLPAHEFEGLGNGDDVVDPGSDLEGFDLVAAPAAHGGYDGALGAAGDVRLVSGLADAFNDVVDFLLGGFLGHVDNHGLVLLDRFFVVVCSISSPRKQKPRSLDRGLRRKLVF